MKFAKLQKFSPSKLDASLFSCTITITSLFYILCCIVVFNHVVIPDDTKELLQYSTDANLKMIPSADKTGIYIRTYFTGV